MSKVIKDGRFRIGEVSDGNELKCQRSHATPLFETNAIHFRNFLSHIGNPSVLLHALCVHTKSFFSLTVELEGLGDDEEGDVVVEGERAPLLVDGEVGGGAHLLVAGDGVELVLAEGHHDGLGAVQAVGGGQDHGFSRRIRNGVILRVAQMMSDKMSVDIMLHKYQSTLARHLSVFKAKTEHG